MNIRDKIIEIIDPDKTWGAWHKNERFADQIIALIISELPEERLPKVLPTDPTYTAEMLYARGYNDCLNLIKKTNLQQELREV